MTAATSPNGFMEMEEPFDPSTSLLEDFLESTTLLPAELKRTATLLREVDAKYAHDVSLLKAAQEEHLDAVARKAPNATQLGALVAMHKRRLDTRLEEKKALVQQLFDTTNRSISRLNRDIKNFQGILKEAGDLDDTALMLAGEQPAFVARQSSSGRGASGSTPMMSPAPAAAQPARRSSALPPAARSTTPPAAAGAIQATLEKCTPGTLVAACTPNKTENGQDLWILAKVISVTADGNVAVADAESDSDRFLLSPRQIVVLIENEDVSHARTRLGTTKNRRVMALYPDTTSFYAASIAQAPFRSTAADPSLNGKVCIGCIFDDDEDPSTGIAPKREVPVRLAFVL